MMTPHYILTRLRGRYTTHYFPVFKQKPYPDNFQEETNRANSLIYDLLSKGKPCMVSRFGSNELYATISYIKGRHPLWFLRTIYPFWVSPIVDYSMKNNAGFFNSSHKQYAEFSDLTVKCAKEIDILGSWQENEYIMDKYLNCERAHIDSLVPFFAEKPWTRYLEGKKVLVIHPFKDSIISQYKNRQQLFSNSDILPEFESLSVIKAIQSSRGEKTSFKTWFDALKYMKEEIKTTDFDVALIGCGAYGMPLAAFVKEQGKQAIHLGGSLQLLFGIKGQRWLKEGFYKEKYQMMMNNPQWIHPLPEEKPKKPMIDRDNCYW